MRSIALLPQFPKRRPSMQGGCNPLPLGGSGAVPQEVLDVVEQCLGLREIRVPQQVEIEVRHGQLKNAVAPGTFKSKRI